VCQGGGDDATRQAYTDGVLVVIDGLAARMAPEDPPSARVKALRASTTPSHYWLPSSATETKRGRKKGKSHSWVDLPHQPIG
jgi:hypothetical protein